MKRSVLKYCRQMRPEVTQGAHPGADSMTLDAAGAASVSCAVHPAVIDHPVKVRYSLEHAVNNLACAGCLPVSVLLSVLLPAGAEEKDLRAVMECAAEVCAQLGVQIGGGHTEIMAAVQKPVLCVTALGLRNTPWSGRIEPELDLLVAGHIAKEGTSLLTLAKQKELCARFSPDFLEKAAAMGESVCILRKAQAALSLGASALHDLSQGGILGALWEMCEGGKTGLCADLRKIPIRQESVEICEYFGLNPYGLLSGGALLIAAKDGKAVCDGLLRQNIPAAVIGRTTAGSGRILKSGDETRFLDLLARDEIYRMGELF